MDNKRFFTLETESKNKYYQIPKIFMVKESKYSSLSAMAKLTYGILADRNSISIENGWIDEEQRVFFIFDQESICEILGVKDPKTVRKYLKELEKIDLIFTVRQGINLPNRLYLLQVEVSESQSYQLIGKKPLSREGKNPHQDREKSPSNKTNINKTNINKTNINKTNISSSKEKVEEEDSDIDLILKESTKSNLKLSRKVVEQLLTGYTIKEILRVIAAINNPSEIKNVGAYMKKSLVENSKSINITKTTVKEVKPNGNFESRDIKNDEELMGWDE
ncbi:replication initiator protein A [uncultured Clostridium sp.]|uniref:replication initiator protein A n=1 Tax=uncultured Clostridium sp. TaxID=59620 RepID=UPI002619425A|nr:replication initiator protein A [uncultured Clostridium sp.]